MIHPREALARLPAIVGQPTLFDHDAYRRLWLAAQLADIPTNAIVYTMFVLVVNDTGRSFFGTLFAASYIAPSVLFAAISGSVVDRLPKGLVMVAGYTVQAGLCFFLAGSTDRVWTIFIIAILFAIVAQFSGPARSASLPLVVPHEDLAAANSLNNLGSLVSRLVGVAVLPLLFLKTIGPAPLAITCAALFLASAYHVLGIKGLGGQLVNAAEALQDTRGRLLAAWRQVVADEVAYTSVALYVLASVVAIAVATLIPSFASDVLGVKTEYAVFVAAPAAIGIWLALRTMDVVLRAAPLRWTISLSFLALVLAVLALGFVRPLGAALEGVFGGLLRGRAGLEAGRLVVTMLVAVVVGFAFTFINVADGALINRRMPHDVQGRVFAGQNVLANVASIPPILVTGLAADLVGVPPVYVGAAVACALAGVFLVVFRPAFLGSLPASIRVQGDEASN